MYHKATLAGPLSSQISQAAAMHHYAMTIDGKSVETDTVFEVVNPATGKVIGTAPECGRDMLDQAFQNAAGALPSWKSDLAARRTALLKAADIIEANLEELTALQTAEQGKPLPDSRLECQMSATWLRFYANYELRLEVIRDDADVHVEVQRVPLGVVAAITPWNAPLLLAIWKVAPALRAGNTMVLKPSPFTPLSTLLMGSLLNQALPPGVLNVISGGDDLGAWMTSHPIPRKVSFTGSVATGKLVAASAAKDLKRLTLELGGNDAAIIMDDADIDKIARPLFSFGFINNGQICGAIKRIYVPRKLHDGLAANLAAIANSTVVGDGSQAGTQLGPINNRPQFERVKELLADALENGATALSGGKVADDGTYFITPTILVGTHDGMRVVDEEQFGPLLPLIPYDDVEVALSAANATTFGLSGSVWGTDERRAIEIADRMEVGTVWINTHCEAEPAQPFAGSKCSGLGVENGLDGLLGFTEPKVLRIRRDVVCAA